MLKPKVTHNVICKDTKLASFLRQNLGEFYNEFVYNYDVCVRDRENIKLFVPFILNKYAYQLLVVCKEYFIICGNPPSMIDIKISYEDLVELKIIDDIAKFLDGKDRLNAIHIQLKFKKFGNTSNQNTQETDSPRELITKTAQLKKEMNFLKDIEQKVNTARSTKSTNYPVSSRSTPIIQYWSINTDDTLKSYENQLRLDTLLLTSRSAKSVNFIDELKEYNIDLIREEEEEKNDENKESDNQIDKGDEEFSYTPRTERYAKLVNSLKVPPLVLETPREVFKTNDKPEKIDKEDIIIKKNEKSIDIETLNLYLLNSNTTIIETLRTAYLNCKIRLVENLKIFTLKRKITAKFNEIRDEILKNFENTSNNLPLLLDELLCACEYYPIIKRLFWSKFELYEVIMNFTSQYIQKIPLIISKNEFLPKDLEEFECFTTSIECIAKMLNETEFYEERNRTLQNNRCKYLKELVDFLINNSENFYVEKLAQITSFNSTLNSDELKDIHSELTIISVLIIWEVFHFTKLTIWTSEHYNFDTIFNSLKENTKIEFYLSRVINELSKLIFKYEKVVLSSKETVVFYKMLNLVEIFIKNSDKCLKHIQDSYTEEFKYFINEETIRNKCYSDYPIFDELIKTFRNVIKMIF